MTVSQLASSAAEAGVNVTRASASRFGTGGDVGELHRGDRGRLLVGADERVADHREDRGRGADGDGAHRRRADLRLDRQAHADPGADERGGDGHREAEQRGLGQQRRRPRQRHPHVRPRPLGGEADRPDADARPQAAGERLVARDEQRDALDEQRLDDVERHVRRRLPEHRADEQREAAADDEEEHDGAERRAAPEPLAHGDEADRPRRA